MKPASPALENGFLTTPQTIFWALGGKDNFIMDLAAIMLIQWSIIVLLTVEQPCAAVHDTMPHCSILAKDTGLECDQAFRPKVQLTGTIGD